jgi:hypothetical protein
MRPPFFRQALQCLRDARKMEESRAHNAYLWRKAAVHWLQQAGQADRARRLLRANRSRYARACGVLAHEVLS